MDNFRLVLRIWRQKELSLSYLLLFTLACCRSEKSPYLYIPLCIWWCFF